MKATVTSESAFDSAVARIQELTGAPEDTPEELELVELVLAVEERALMAHLLAVIATEGMVNSARLEPHAVIDDVGLTLDDLTLIANRIEREFDCDMVPDDEMQACQTVRQLVTLMATRLRANDNLC